MSATCRREGTPAGVACYHISACGCQVIDDPENPPAIPCTLRVTIIVGVFLSGAATGWATAATLITGGAL